MAFAVRFEGVSKRYPRGWNDQESPRYASLRTDLLRIGRRAHRAPGGLALADVSFEIDEGKSFALIGPNGAGKSTALKLLSRITYPTEGLVRVRGRVAALMEVGSGVHPELTGRENIWLYGQILGLRRADIARRFDEIVEFAELHKAIDTPVKFFSSGMQLRLGFSIAAHLEPDVMAVDEALAVGDAAFQARCMERMRQLVGEGRTLLFVSHSLAAVRETCERALLLSEGRTVKTGPTAVVIDAYLARVRSGQLSGSNRRTALRVVRMITRSSSGEVCTEGDVQLVMELEADEAIEGVSLGVSLTDGRIGDLTSFSMRSSGETVDVPAGRSVLTTSIQRLPLLPGQYEVWFEASRSTGVYVAEPHFAGIMVVTQGPSGRKAESLYREVGVRGPVHMDYRLKFERYSSTSAYPRSKIDQS